MAPTEDRSPRATVEGLDDERDPITDAALLTTESCDRAFVEFLDALLDLGLPGGGGIVFRVPIQADEQRLRESPTVLGWKCQRFLQQCRNVALHG
jgi:hypothetical protein